MEVHCIPCLRMTTAFLLQTTGDICQKKNQIPVMSLKKILSVFTRNVVFKKQYATTQEPTRPTRRSDLKLRRCPCSMNKDNFIENATVHENARRKQKKFRKTIEDLMKEAEKKNSFPGIRKK